MEITINIDTRTKAGANLLNFLKSLNFVTIKKIKKKKEASELLQNAINNVNNNKNLTVMNGKDKLSKFLLDEI